MAKTTTETVEKKTHYNAIATASIIILAILLGIGFWLLFTGNLLTDQTVLDPATPAIVPVSPDTMVQ
jgi:hypothetical protein